MARRSLFNRRPDADGEIIRQVSDDDLLSWRLDLLTVSPTEPMVLHTSRPERPLRAAPRRVRVRPLRATTTD